MPHPSYLAALLGDPPPWHKLAACADIGGDAWYPERGSNGAAARRICERCEVADICRQDAIDRNEPFGVWGGLSEYDRERLKQRAA